MTRLMRIVVGMLAAACVGATFTDILFVLPVLTRLADQPSALGLWVAPTAAAITIVAVIVAAQRFPSLAVGDGYPFAAVGALVAGVAITALSNVVRGGDPLGVEAAGLAVLNACGAGLALGSLAIAIAATSAGLERLAIGAGLAAGILAARAIALLLPQEAPPYLRTAIVGAVAVLAALLAVASKRATIIVSGRPVGALIGVAVTGVSVMAALLARRVSDGQFRKDGSELLPDAAPYALIGLAALAGLALAWIAHSCAGSGAARLPLLGFALAGTIALNSYPLQRPQTAAAILTGVVAAIAGAALAAAAPRLMAWEALGALVVAAGLLMIQPALPTSDPTGAALVLGGAGFALGAGLVHAAKLPAGATAVGVGVASLLLVVQAIGPFVDWTLTRADPALPEPSLAIAAIGAALAIMALFLFTGKPEPDVQAAQEDSAALVSVVPFGEG